MEQKKHVDFARKRKQLSYKIPFYMHKIYEWRKERQRKTCCSLCNFFLYHKCSLDVLQVFVGGINILVLTQLGLGVGAVYFIRYFKLQCLLNTSLVVSPIVFPLAFSINIDFQRRENILEKLGQVKTCIMVLYIGMKESEKAFGLNPHWINTFREKLASFSLSMREYLVSEQDFQRKAIVNVIYQNITAINQLLWQIPHPNYPHHCRVIKLFTELCKSFESLQNYREYRSSRGIRAFNKVMIFLLPVVLSPYFVYIGNISKSNWAAYYICLICVFIFSTLQGVHDKLDNPFDAFGEDDVDVSAFEEWVFNTLDLTHTPRMNFQRPSQRPSNISLHEEDLLGVKSEQHNSSM